MSRRWLATSLLAVFLIPIFWLNAGATANNEFFATWQLDSQALVLGKIESDRRGLTDSDFGLVGTSPDLLAPYATIDAPPGELENSVVEQYNPYGAQLGLMGYFYSAVQAYTPCSSLNCLTLLSASLFVVFLLLLSFLLSIIARPAFGVMLVVSMVASPWMVTAAPNLYWSPWLWLLPACAAAIYVLAKTRVWKALSLVALFLAFVVRFSSGYEYVTSMVLMAAVIPAIRFAFLPNPSRAAALRACRDFVVVVGLGIVGFGATLLLHARLRGAGDIPLGLVDIWQNDVLRRTYGDSGAFDSTLSASLEASPFAVVQSYLFTWTTDFLHIGGGTPLEIVLKGNALWLLIGACVAIVVARAIQRDSLWKRDLLLLISTAAIPLSWFILGKAHSYVHTPVNFVLWYLLFAGVLLFITYDFIVSRRFVQNLLHSIRGWNGKASAATVEERVSANTPHADGDLAPTLEEAKRSA